MKGRIIKGLGGLYDVDLDGQVLQCKPKGLFRKDKIKALIGDAVEVEALPDGTGLITDIYDRTSYLIRPEVANATQCFLVFAIKNPNPPLTLLDRVLINMQKEGLKCVLVFNKCDLATDEEKQEIRDIYCNSGCEVCFIAAKEGIGVDDLKEMLKGQITVLSGPSGVGKSTLVNQLLGREHMETGEISEKIQRGKHTTRHSELFGIGEDTYIFDTPGFTSFDVCGVEAADLFLYYDEMKEAGLNCKYTGCSHINEPGCAIKDMVSDGSLSKVRYENYKTIYNEIKNRKKIYR